MSSRLIAYFVAVTLLVTSVLFSPSWGNWLWLRTLHDFAHGPVFGLIAVVLLMAQRQLGRGDTRQQYVVAMLISVILGGGTELIQWITGRDPSWRDFGADILGIATFVASYAAFDARLKGLRRGLMALATIGIAAMLWPLAITAHAYYERAAAFPLIFDLNRGLGMYFITTRQVQIGVERLPAPWSQESALLVEFLPGKWQGIELREPPPDWRGYDHLLVDLVNPSSELLRVVVRVDDEQHNLRFADRYNGNFDVAAHSRSSLRIPIDAIRTAPKDRDLDLARIARVVVFRREDSQAPAMFVSRMKLERAP